MVPAGEVPGRLAELVRTFAILFKFLSSSAASEWKFPAVRSFSYFLGGGPVDERAREFFPVFAFSAEVADARSRLRLYLVTSW
jgi:hypothetical protein